jgi:hypothetical protein
VAENRHVLNQLRLSTRPLKQVSEHARELEESYRLSVTGDKL